MGFVGKAIGGLLGARKSSTTVQQSSGAAAAPAPAVDAKNNDSNIDTEATKRKKKAMGKKGLMIGKGSDAAGGGTTGTGLNL